MATAIKQPRFRRAFRHVPLSVIEETLAIYRPEYVALHAAEWNGTLLRGHLCLSEYPFTKQGHIGYVTTAMATLYVSQMAYVHSRLTIEERLLPQFPVTLDRFFCARDRGDLVIVQFFLKCRRKLPVALGSLPVELWVRGVHSTKSHVLAKFGFDFHGSSFVGHATMAMPL